MPEQEQVKRQLEEQLGKVKQRLLMLNMIEDKLFQMKYLAQSVIDGGSTEEEIQEINKQVKYLEDQVRLLDKETTQLA